MVGDVIDLSRASQFYQKRAAIAAVLDYSSKTEPRLSMSKNRWGIALSRSQSTFTAT
jgi:hypothetical protein